MEPATHTTSLFSLHVALPIFGEDFGPPHRDGRVPAAELGMGVRSEPHAVHPPRHRQHALSDAQFARLGVRGAQPADRKSTRLNSSHANISYAVFCLKKKKKGS